MVQIAPIAGNLGDVGASLFKLLRSDEEELSFIVRSTAHLFVQHIIKRIGCVNCFALVLSN